MTVIRISVATVTASLADKISLCAAIVYNHRLGRRKWRYNRSVKPAPGTLMPETVGGQATLRAKLQAPVCDILPSTTAVFIYAIGSTKLSANEQFFCWRSNSSKFVTNNSNYIRRLFHN